MHERVFKFLTVAVVASLAALACSRTPYGVQQRYARSLTPRAPRPQEAHGPAREMTLRVYADPSFRSGRTRWRQKFGARLAGVNAVLQAGFGVRLVVAGMYDWERTGSGTRLSDVLAALEREDSAEEVDWVVGLTTSTPMVSSSLHELGMAIPMSKYFVLRGMDDIGEAKQIDAVFSALSGEQRRELYFKRKKHKELVVFLHEWAHTLGGIHSSQSAHVLNPTYDSEQGEFCAPNAHIIRLGLRHRQQGADEQDYANKLATYIKNTEWVDWHDGDRKQLLAYLEQWKAHPASKREGARAPVFSGGRAERLVHDDTSAYLRAGDIDTAWATLQPALKKFPSAAKLHLLACYVGEQSRQPSVAVVAACARAATLDPRDVRVAVLVGRMLAKGGDLRGAAKSLLLAEKLLGNVTDDETWRAIAQAYQNVGFVTYAERAGARIENASEITDWAKSIRRRQGLPKTSRRFALKPADEAEYAKGFWAINEEIREGNLKGARTLVTQGLRRFADAPGYLAQQCEIHLRRSEVTPARASCERAIAIDNECAWAHFLLGTIFDHQLRRDKAAHHFVRVIDLDPTLEAAWKSLSHVYRELGKKSDLDKLKVHYKKQFSRAL